MQQEITIHNKVDEDGNPAGGSILGIGINIRWQDGPLGRGNNRKEPNGAFVEGVALAVVERLKFYQNSKFACTENALALDHIEQALDILNERTKRREAEGTEGTHAESPEA